MEQLSSRLEKILNLIEDDSKGVLDIGSDHALLPLGLEQRGFKGPIYASEAAKGPYLRMVAALKDHKSHITPLFGDGLKVYLPPIDQVIMAGLGGITISQILLSSPAPLKSISVLLIEPQSNVDLALKACFQSGFYQQEAIYIKEKSKVYPIIKLKKGVEKDFKPLFYYFPKPALENKDVVLYEYLIGEKSLYTSLLGKVISEKDLLRIKANLALIDSALTYY